MNGIVGRLLGMALGLTLAAGCGYTEEEWQAQLDKYKRLMQEHQATQAKLDQASRELATAQERVRKLERDLESAGVDIGKLSTDLASRTTEISKLSASLEEREAALAAYRERAAQLERIKQRFELLRRKLTDLTSLGLNVSIRNNRMVIAMPGDVLFASGRDSLKKEGQQILDKVAEIINGDASLRSRYYQVGGHTDNQPLKGGGFYDNWGLSVMRSRSVLVYLIERGLPPQRWGAAGFADTDPIADNESPDGRQKNRRCEIIVLPSAEEMLDLRNIAQ
jgi:chemotaxis protein MotB